jgi:hypothetical protein
MSDEKNRSSTGGKIKNVLLTIIIFLWIFGMIYKGIDWFLHRNDTLEAVNIQGWTWKEYKECRDTTQVKKCLRSLYKTAYNNFIKDGGTEKTFISERKNLIDYFNTRDYIIDSYGGAGDCSLIENQVAIEIKNLFHNRNQWLIFLEKEFNLTLI